MQLHVLAGCRELLHPEILPTTVATDLIGPGVQVARAYWISRQSGDEYHDFLQDDPGDRRTFVMAESLRDEFGVRFAPLLILADLLDEITRVDGTDPVDTTAERRSQLAVLSEILACGHVDRIQLHALALTDEVDPDGAAAVLAGTVPRVVQGQVERLQGALSDHTAPDSIAINVIESTPDHPVFNTLYNNALCNEFTRRLERCLSERGWVADKPELTHAVSEILSELNGRGVYASLPLGAERLADMTDFICQRLLKG